MGNNQCQITQLKNYINIGASDSSCFQSDSLMFMQVGCVIPQEDLESRVERGLVLSCAAVFIALFVVNYLDFTKRVQENNYLEWDVKTITAGDFSIEFDLDPTFFADFLAIEKPDWVKKCAEKGMTFNTDASCFHTWIRYEMERRLSLMPDLGFEEEPVEDIKIAVTKLAFKNAEIVNLLRLRGAAIKAENWEEQKKIED